MKFDTLSGLQRNKPKITETLDRLVDVGLHHGPDLLRVGSRPEDVGRAVDRTKARGPVVDEEQIVQRLEKGKARKSSQLAWSHSLPSAKKGTTKKFYRKKF